MAAGRRAIELDSGLAEAHRAMANVLSLLLPQSAQTDSEIEREYLLALRLDPASAETRHRYAMFLSSCRRSDEAIAQMRDALRLDPLSPNIMGRLGMELAGNGQVEEGLRLMQRAVDLEPWQFNAQLRLGSAYAAFGRFEEAERALEVAERISPGTPHALATRSYVAARLGDVEHATAGLAELEAKAAAIDAPFLVAVVYSGLRDRDGALRWLEKGAATHPNLPKASYYGMDSPIYDWLRDDPRFERVRRRLQGSTQDPQS